MDHRIFFEQLCSLDSKITIPEIKNEISLLDEESIAELIEKIQYDFDAQVAVNAHLEKAFSMDNINPKVKQKADTILEAIENCAQEISESDETTFLVDNTADLDSRISVLRKMMVRNLTKTQGLKAEHKQLHKDIEDATLSLQKAQKALEDDKERSKNLLSQSIEILGIFVAIITIFFGGFAGISSVGSIQNLNTYKFILYIVLIGQIMLDLIFMFVYMLGRIIDKSVSVNCGYYQSIPCTPNDNSKNGNDLCRTCFCNTADSCKAAGKQLMPCTMFRRLRYKYPYVYFINMLAILLELALCIGWLFSDSIILLKSYLSNNILFPLIIFTVFIFGAVYTIKKFKDKL